MPCKKKKYYKAVITLGKKKYYKGKYKTKRQALKTAERSAKKIIKLPKKTKKNLKFKTIGIGYREVY